MRWYQNRRNMSTSLRAYKNTVFICDTGNKSLRMLMSAKTLIPLQKRFAFLNRHEHNALERTGKRNTNDPDLTVPRATRQSFLIVLESLTSLANTLTEIGHGHLLDRICFESMTTLSVECFFKGMRDHDMPRHAHRGLLRFQKSSLRPRRHASHLPEGIFVFHRAQFILSGENNQG